MRCKRIVRVASGRWKTPRHEGGEYENMAAFTFFVLNEDVDAAVHADYLCNEYGLDTISTGAAIAFAMDCYGSGIISREEADGLDLSWGNAETMVELVERICRREGIGWLLGEGVRRASHQIGRGSEKLAIHVKGLEGPAHDPRSAKTLAVAYGLGNRGMCHIHPLEVGNYDALNNDFGLIPYGLPDPETVDRYAEEGKGEIVKKLQDFGVLPDILGICKFYVFVGVGPGELASMVSSLTGWDVDGEELLKVGERVYDLQRVFNTREGITKADDLLPERCLRLPEFGKYASVKECEIRNLTGMLEDCYQARGWSKETGVPRGSI
jgi:aldehyde:ferredoxin oxidoreductase